MSYRIYLMVEGVVDLAVMGRLLANRGFTRVKDVKELGEWSEYQAGFTYPKSGAKTQDISDFSIRAPEYFRNGEALVVLRCGNGNEMFVDFKNDLLQLSRSYVPDAIGIVGDADEKLDLTLDDWQRKLAKIGEQVGLEFPIPSQSGVVTTQAGRKVGFFLFPGAGSGTIEDVLLALGQRAFPVLRSKAGDYVEGVRDDDFPQSRDLKELRKPAGRNKAILSAMVAVLRPEKATPLTLREDRWLDSEIIEATPEMQSCIRFLTDLLTPTKI